MAEVNYSVNGNHVFVRYKDIVDIPKALTADELIAAANEIITKESGAEELPEITELKSLKTNIAKTTTTTEEESGESSSESGEENKYIIDSIRTSYDEDGTNFTETDVGAKIVLYGDTGDTPAELTVTEVFDNAFTVIVPLISEEQGGGPEGGSGYTNGEQIILPTNNLPGEREGIFTLIVGEGGVVEDFQTVQTCVLTGETFEGMYSQYFEEHQTIPYNYEGTGTGLHMIPDARQCAIAGTIKAVTFTDGKYAEGFSSTTPIVYDESSTEAKGTYGIISGTVNTDSRFYVTTKLENDGSEDEESDSTTKYAMTVSLRYVTKTEES